MQWVFRQGEKTSQALLTVTSDKQHSAAICRSHCHDNYKYSYEYSDILTQVLSRFRDSISTGPQFECQKCERYLKQVAFGSNNTQRKWDF